MCVSATGTRAGGAPPHGGNHTGTTIQSRAAGSGGQPGRPPLGPSAARQSAQTRPARCGPRPEAGSSRERPRLSGQPATRSGPVQVRWCRYGSGPFNRGAGSLCLLADRSERPVASRKVVDALADPNDQAATEQMLQLPRRVGRRPLDNASDVPRAARLGQAQQNLPTDLHRHRVVLERAHGLPAAHVTSVKLQRQANPNQARQNGRRPIKAASARFSDGQPGARRVGQNALHTTHGRERQRPEPNRQRCSGN